MDKISNILPEEERKRLLQEHHEESVKGLLKIRRELLAELVDIEVALADKGACTGDAILYIGCHTKQKHEDRPKFKMEVLFHVDCYKYATKIVRGLKDNVERLLRLPEEINKEVGHGSVGCGN